MKRFAIIGGGITGLSAAFYLEKYDPECEITLFERTNRLGGTISSPKAADAAPDGAFRFEAGPDSFLSYKQAALDLVDELGIMDRLVNSSVRSVYVVRDGKLVSFPAGFQFFVPTGWSALANTQLLSWSAKLQAVREAFRDRRSKAGGDTWADPAADISVADFARDRFGQEACDYLAAPLLSGIYGGDAEKLSMAIVLPKFLEYEAKQGNVIRGVVAAARESEAAKRKATKPAWAPFVSFKSGMQELTDTLAARLNRTRVMLGESVDSMPAGFDAVIVAAPPVHGARLLKASAPDVAEILGQIPCNSTTTVSLYYRDGDLPVADGGFGFLSPDVEHRKILGCSWLSAKFPGRGPAGYTYVRGFLRGIHDPSSATDAMLSEMRDLMAVTKAPEKVHVANWPEVMAQPLVGHKARIAELRRRVEQRKGLALAGNYFEGIGIPDCIRTAKLAAERVTGTPPGTTPPTSTAR